MFVVAVVFDGVNLFPVSLCASFASSVNVMLHSSIRTAIAA